jgi:hypothetical protein
VPRLPQSQRMLAFLRLGSAALPPSPLLYRANQGKMLFVCCHVTPRVFAYIFPSPYNVKPQHPLATTFGISYAVQDSKTRARPTSTPQRSALISVPKSTLAVSASEIVSIDDNPQTELVPAPVSSQSCVSRISTGRPYRTPESYGGTSAFNSSPMR